MSEVKFQCKNGTCKIKNETRQECSCKECECNNCNCDCDCDKCDCDKCDCCEDNSLTLSKVQRDCMWFLGHKYTFWSGYSIILLLTGFLGGCHSGCKFNCNIKL